MPPDKKEIAGQQQVSRYQEGVGSQKGNKLHDTGIHGGHMGSNPVEHQEVNLVLPVNDHLFYQEGKYQGSGTGFLTVIIIILVLVFGLVMYGLAKLIIWLYHYAQDL